MPLPDELDRLLNDTGERRGSADPWAAFLLRYSPLLLKTARSLGGSHDAVMDRYTYVLDGLRADDFHRLRVFRDDGRATFVTWLVVTTRRLCLDHHRQRYGRPRTDASTQVAERRGLRRSLADLVGLDVHAVDLPDGEPLPDEQLERKTERATLDSALADLAYPDRLLLALRFEDDLSAREIAQLTGMASPFQVYRRLDRVLATLRASLGRIASGGR
jgi:RNA polymerase sigma factor (sigma-70 family)